MNAQFTNVVANPYTIAMSPWIANPMSQRAAEMKQSVRAFEKRGDSVDRPLHPAATIK